MFRFLYFGTGREPFRNAKKFECSWEEFAADLQEAGFAQVDDSLEDAKTYAPQLLAADFVEGADQKKSDLVTHVNLYVLDLDDVPKSMYRKVEALIREEGLAALAYTSYSHIESVRACKGYRVRVIFPLSRPVVKDTEWKRFWSNMRLKFFGCADSTTATAGKAYLMPSIPQKYVGTRSEKITFIREFKGKPIDVDAMLAAYQLDPVISATRKDRNQPVSGAAVNLFLKEQRKGRTPEQKQLAIAFDNANNGEPYAAKGQRDDILFRMASRLGEDFPLCDAAQVASYFKSGIEAARAADPTDPGPTFEDFVNKLLRAQEHTLIEAEKRKQENTKKKKALGQTGTFEQVIGAYTEESIRKFIEETRCGTALEDFSRRLLLVTDDAYYIFNGNGYTRANKQTFYNICLENLSHRAKSLGFDLYYPATENSPPKLKGINALLMEYGHSAKEVVYKFGVTTHFDESAQKLVLCECSIDEQVQPREHPEVDAWIDAISPTPEIADNMRDWLAQAPDTDRALCAITLVGQHGIGKSAFATGVAALWKSAPVPMKSAISNFNAQMRTCPIIFADEKLPEVNGRVPTDEIRSIISTGEFFLNEKHKNPCFLKGYVRMVVALNSMDNFKLGETTHTSQDTEAVAKRFLFVNTPNDKSELARSLFKYDKFVEQRAIAEHALHLHCTRPRKSDRFGVDTNSYQEIARGDWMTETVLQWVCKQLGRKTANAEEPRPATVDCFVSNGSVYVHARRVYENWGEDLTRWRPKYGDVLNAIGVVSEGEPVRIKIGTLRERFFKIRADLLRNYAVEKHLSENFDLMLRISTELDFKERAFMLTPEQRIEREALLRRYRMGEANDNSRAAE